MTEGRDPQEAASDSALDVAALLRAWNARPGPLDPATVTEALEDPGVQVILRETNATALVIALLGTCHELMRLFARSEGCATDDEIRDCIEELLMRMTSFTLQPPA